jgi:formate-dependent nitrite reductase membrane component NrfD
VFLLVAQVMAGGLLIGEFGGAHANVDVARAARLITRGALSSRFWGGVVIVGIALPVLLIGMSSSLAPLLCPVFALIGLAIYEDVWVKAGQSVPLS